MALLVAFVVGAYAQARWVNVNATTHDQSAYLAQARMLAETHFTVPTNRIEMPAFPAILSLFWKDGLTDDAWFWRAKLVAIGVALLSAIAAALTLRRVLPEPSARFAQLVIVFFVFMFRAAYVQTEPLYYLLALWSLLALDAVWRKPTFGRAVLAGVVIALAWLTKASILVAAMIAVPLFLLRETIVCARKHSWSTLATRISMVICGAFAFAAVISPYAMTSKELHGKWLYNMSPTYVMWCDSWEDFIDHMRRLGPVEGWRTLPDQSDVPSMQHYLATHSIAHIAWRTVSGLGLVLANLLLSPFGPLLFATMTLVAIIHFKRARLRELWRTPSSWFVVYVVAHFVLQGFYAPIAAGPRFSIAIAMPAFVMAVRAMSEHANDAVTVFGRETSWARTERTLERVAVLLMVMALPIAVLTLYCGG
jgi:hypothetical protein